MEKKKECKGRLILLELVASASESKSNCSIKKKIKKRSIKHQGSALHYTEQE